MSSPLWLHLTPQYRRYPSSQHGGPLVFYLLMKEFVINTCEAATHLVQTLEKYSLANIKGENVTELTKIVRATVNRLKNMKDPDTNAFYLPKSLPKTLLEILQTSSVEAFNKIFQFKQETAEANSDPDQDTNYGRVDSLLTKAEGQYKKLLLQGEWLGTNTTGDESAFISGQQPNLKCFNCGKPDHTANNCPLPLNEDRIKRNKEKYME